MASSSPFPRPAIPWQHRLIALYLQAPEHPCRLRIIGWLERLWYRKKVRIEVIPGVIMNLDARDYVQREILYYGGYERATLRLFHRLLEESAGFLDIGAHHGQYSLRAARTLAPRGGRVFAFEPMPLNCAALLENAACSGLANIDVCTAALSDAPGIMRLVQSAPTNTGAARLAAGNPPRGNAPGIHVAVLPFTAMAGMVPPEALDLVKIDVEGFEARVLTSLLAGGARRPRHIIFEYAFQSFDYGIPEGLPAWLEKQGYTVRDVTGAPFSPDRPLPEDNLWAELNA